MTPTDKKLQSFAEFAVKHPDMLLMCAIPETDQIFITYNGQHTHVVFPRTEKKSLDVVKNVLKYSKFDKNIDVFMAGFDKAMEVSPETDEAEGSVSEMYNVIGGSIQAIAKAEAVGRIKKVKSVK